MGSSRRCGTGVLGYPGFAGGGVIATFSRWRRKIPRNIPQAGVFISLNNRMKIALLIATTLFATAIAADAAKIAIKNDIGSSQRVMVLQAGKVKGYVANLKAKKTFLVTVDSPGPKVMIMLNNNDYVFVPAKNNAFKIGGLFDLRTGTDWSGFYFR
jgi:hypothetical protein